MNPVRVGLAALLLASLAAPACANPFDSLRWRVEDAIADTAARKVESALSGEGRQKKEKPAPKPAATPTPMAAPAPTAAAPVAPAALPAAPAAAPR